MFLRTLVCFLLVCVSLCYALTCSGGLYKSISSRCELHCGKKKCICAKDDKPSNVKGCLQKCSPSIPNNPNITVHKCLDMHCTDLDSCHQVCQNQECKMQCKSKTCAQECESGNCTKLVCSGKQCNQQCKDCTMECTEGVEECNQQCFGGVCRAICPKGTNCQSSCSAADNEKCQIISASTRFSSLPFTSVITLIGAIKTFF